MKVAALNALRTAPNLLTILRICLAPFLVAAILERRFEVGLALFIVAGLTDALDGLLARWLKQNKEWSREQWRMALRNRFLSEGIVKSQPIYLWLARLVEYVEAPLDRYGKVMVNGGGKVGEAITREQSNNAARQQAVAAAGSNA